MKEVVKCPNDLDFRIEVTRDGIRGTLEDLKTCSHVDRKDFYEILVEKSKALIDLLDQKEKL